jgi:ribonuclease Z
MRKIGVPCVGYAFSERRKGGAEVDAEVDRANRVGHTVWSRLKPVVEAHPETLFVLVHFSLRNSDREVIEFFQWEWEEAKDARPDNVLLWAHPESRMPEQHQHS